MTIMSKTTLLTLLPLLFTACASTTWVKPGATEYDLSKDRSGCLREAQVSHMGSTKMTTEGQFGSNHYVVDERLFAACMDDHGWHQQ